MNTVTGHISFSEVDKTSVKKNQAYSLQGQKPRDSVVRLIKVPLWMHSDVVIILYLFDIVIVIFVT